ncbi:MAG: fatty acid--CoA ligase family protein [Devosia sp.]|nr:fatty acid--CoA ligase family protein [Devosia sp.]
MQLFRQVIFQARLREEEPAVATPSAVISYRTLAKSVEAALVALGPIERRGAAAVIDVAQPLHHLYLLLALGLLGVPTASLVGSGGPLPDTGPAPTLLLTDANRGDGGSVATRRVDQSWFTTDAKRAPNYARMLALSAPLPGDMVRYLYSSGTTGRRKCIGYSMDLLSNMVRNTSFLVAGRSAPSAASMCLMDFSTIGGTTTPFRALTRGGLLCVAPNPASAIDLIRLFHVEELNASVGQARMLLDQLRGRQPLSSLRTLLLSGSRTPLRLLAEIHARLCADVRLFYGSTEMGIVAIGSGGVLERQEGSVGYVVPGAEVEIVDETGRPVAPGEEGVIRVRPERCAPYIGTFGEELEAPADGWFYPGDVARLAPDGVLVISGRAGDVINKGGVIIAPEVIEEAFRRDPRVKDVAAFSLPGQRGLEEVCVAVVVEEGVNLDALNEAIGPSLAERSPDRILRVAAIPRNENQKIQRFKLREQFAAATPRR